MVNRYWTNWFNSVFQKVWKKISNHQFTRQRSKSILMREKFIMWNSSVSSERDRSNLSLARKSSGFVWTWRTNMSWIIRQHSTGSEESNWNSIRRSAEMLFFDRLVPMSVTSQRTDLKNSSRCSREKTQLTSKAIVSTDHRIEFQCVCKSVWHSFGFFWYCYKSVDPCTWFSLCTVSICTCAKVETLRRIRNRFD